MSKYLVPPKTAPKKEEDSSNLRRGLQVVKSTLQVTESIKARNPERTLQQAIAAGLKMASPEIFHNPWVAPLKLTEALRRLGVSVLGWAPETLMATLDQKFSGWDGQKVQEAIEYFHKTGALKTDIPQLVREKIYAIRVVATSNSAQTEWHVFEKVGGAFNDRIAKFGLVEALTPAEAARTVAIIENIRPDEYSNEIKIYLATCCHEDGLYTVAPVKWLSMAEQYLQQMNSEATQTPIDPALRDKITQRYQELKARKTTLREVADDMVSVQAAKLLAIDEYAEEATNG